MRENELDVDLPINANEPTPGWNQQRVIIIVCAASLTLSWMCVTLRMYTRFRVLFFTGWDDVCVVLALLSVTAGCVSITLSTDHGLGRHIWSLNLSQIQRFFLRFYVGNATYTMSTALIKLALLIQYIRAFRALECHVLRRICLAMTVVVGLFGITYTFIAWFPCFPVNKFWDMVGRESCYGFGSLDESQAFATFVSQSAINMALDTIILLIPMPLSWNKESPRNTRLGLIALLTMGLAIAIFSVWRTIAIVENHATFRPVFDPTWYVSIDLILSILEVNAAVICASIPVFWPVITSRLDRIFVTKEFTVEHSERSPRSSMNEFACDPEGPFSGYDFSKSTHWMNAYPQSAKKTSVDFDNISPLTTLNADGDALSVVMEYDEETYLHSAPYVFTGHDVEWKPSADQFTMKHISPFTNTMTETEVQAQVPEKARKSKKRH